MTGLLGGMAEQAGKAVAAVGYVGVPCLIYYVARGRKSFRPGAHFVGALCLSFLLCVGAFMAVGRATARYYLVLVPLLYVLCGAGLRALLNDLGGRRLALALCLPLLIAYLVVDLHEPLRAHRRPQTVAGRWLHEQDPGYDGFVLSNWSQPVFYAGMRYLPSDRQWTPQSYRELCEHGLAPRYAILGAPRKRPQRWVRDLVEAEHWRLIYRDDGGPIHIYRRPAAGREEDAVGRGTGPTGAEPTPQEAEPADGR